MSIDEEDDVLYDIDGLPDDLNLYNSQYSYSSSDDDINSYNTCISPDNKCHNCKEVSDDIIS